MRLGRWSLLGMARGCGRLVCVMPTELISNVPLAHHTWLQVDADDPVYESFWNKLRALVTGATDTQPAEVTLMDIQIEIGKLDLDEFRALEQFMQGEHVRRKGEVIERIRARIRA